MNKKMEEIDFIGGEGSLTTQEELALAKYFAEKKEKAQQKKGNLTVSKIRSQRAQVKVK